MRMKVLVFSALVPLALPAQGPTAEKPQITDLGHSRGRGASRPGNAGVLGREPQRHGIQGGSGNHAQAAWDTRHTALAKEATGTGSLQFSSSRRDEARRQALALAVAKARSEADAMARAGGGSLGGLIELFAEPESARPRFYETQRGILQAAPAAALTPIAPGQLAISATVTGKLGYSQR